MSQLTPEQSETLHFSSKVIQSIDELMEFEPFQEFMQRLTREADAMALAILHDDMTPEDRERLRIKRLGWLEVMKTPAEDRKTHVGIIEAHEAGH